MKVLEALTAAAIGAGLGYWLYGWKGLVVGLLTLTFAHQMEQRWCQQAEQLVKLNRRVRRLQYSIQRAERARKRLNSAGVRELHTSPNLSRSAIR